jgi:hypothetical protein
MGALNSLATVGLNLAMAKKEEKDEKKQLEKEFQRKRVDLLAKASEARREQDQALKRRLAQERARAGAAGISSTGGSIDAVLRGLTAEAKADQAAADAILGSNLRALRDAYGTKKRRNLLDMNKGWIDAGSKTLAGLGRGRSLLD